jgi:hypothetical protein
MQWRVWGVQQWKKDRIDRKAEEKRKNVDGEDDAVYSIVSACLSLCKMVEKWTFVHFSFHLNRH